MAVTVTSRAATIAVHPIQTSDGSVRMIPTPGHTAGHLSVVVDLGEQLVPLTGDATYSEAALGNVIVVPSHDPDGAARLRRLQTSSFGGP